MNGTGLLEKLAYMVHERLEGVGLFDHLVGGSDRFLEKAETEELDLIAREAILEGVISSGIGWGILSEEGRIEKGDGEKELLIDPLDGSYNAINRIPFFSTSLALTGPDGGDITHAVVMDLPLKRIYRGMAGKGSFLGEMRLRTGTIRSKRPVISMYIGEESRLFACPLASAVLRARYLGCDSLEICTVSSGGLDGAIYLGRVPRKTDIAASTLILREAGGSVLSIGKEKGIAECRFDEGWEGLLGIVAIGSRTLEGDLGLTLTGIANEMVHRSD